MRYAIAMLFPLLALFAIAGCATHRSERPLIQPTYSYIAQADEAPADQPGMARAQRER